MDPTLLSFSNVYVNDSLLNQVWSFNPERLETYADVTISKYCIVLAQYLVYFTSRKNITKAELIQKKRELDRSVAIQLTKDVLKMYSAKKDAVDFVIATTPSLFTLSTIIDDLQVELVRIEGVETSIGEYIATFKREMTRREKELQTARYERS